MVAADSGRVKPFTGHLVRGALLKLIKGADPELARMLHEPHQPRPYSVTPALPVNHRRTIRENLWWIKPGEQVRFHVGFLQDHIGEKTLRGILESTPQIKLGETPFNVAKIEIRKTTHQELVETAKPEQTVVMRFRSPTQLTIMRTPPHTGGHRRAPRLGGETRPHTPIQPPNTGNRHRKTGKNRRVHGNPTVPAKQPRRLRTLDKHPHKIRNNRQHRSQKNHRNGTHTKNRTQRVNQAPIAQQKLPS